MITRLDDLPVYARRPDRIEAREYNLWRRARRRWGSPLRLPLAGMRGIEIVLEDRRWVCVDATQGDLPVLAWVDFQTAGRERLDEAVACQLNYYHYAASKLRAEVLRRTAEELQARLQED